MAKAYNGGSISNLIKNVRLAKMYVTDDVAKATRYANAQATGEVSPDLSQEQAEGTVILVVECEPNYIRRSVNHTSLDVCEAVVSEYKITKAIIRFHEYQNTLYGNRHTGYFDRQQVRQFCKEHGIEVEEQN